MTKVCIAGLYAIALTSVLSAQGTTADPHFGGRAFPEDRTAFRVALTFDRFTEYDGDGNASNPNVNQPGRFPSKIAETAGFNVMSVLWSDTLPNSPGWTYTVAGGAGYSADQPTRFLQNQFIHTLRRISFVHVGERRDTELVLSGGASLTYWTDPSWVTSNDASSQEDRFKLRSFVGLGGLAGTRYNEGYAHAGAVLRTPRTSLLWNYFDGYFELGGMFRASIIRPSDAYSDVARSAVTPQFSIGFRPANVKRDDWYTLGNPAFTFTFTWDSGLYEDFRDKHPIDIWFISWKVEWPSGMSFELYNDLLNDTDFGPSYGIQITWDMMALWRSGVLPW